MSSCHLTELLGKDAMDKYGSDKPDLRFDMQIQDVSELVKDSDFKVFAGAVQNGGQVRAIVLPGGADKYSRKMIDAPARLHQAFWCQRFGLAQSHVRWYQWSDCQILWRWC